jgi:hypothetical protein
MVGHGAWARGRGIRKENIKKHVKYGPVGFKGSFLVFILARQNCISLNTFPLYPISFLQYQFFHEFSRYGRDAIICTKKYPFKHFSLLIKK